MTPQEVLDFAKTEIVAASAKRSAVIPAAMIALGFIGLAIGARYGRDAVGMLLGVALGFGLGETLASQGPSAPYVPPPYDPQEADPGDDLVTRRGPVIINPPTRQAADPGDDLVTRRGPVIINPPTRQAPAKQGPPAAS